MAGSAYLIISFQNDYFQGGKNALENTEEASANAGEFLKFVREHNKSSPNDEIKVIHIRFELPENGPFFAKGSPGAEINEIVKPEDNEIQVIKHHSNAFNGTNLKEVLEEHSIDTLYVSGGVLTLCVQGTVRYAHENGYKVVLLKDAVASKSLEFEGNVISAKDVQDTVLATLSFGYGKIKSTKEVIESLSSNLDFV